MKRKIVYTALLFILLVGVEFIARYYGLHDYPLFEKSDDFEYIHSPNQNRLIYRNRFITNDFSMRSDYLSKKDTLVVLLIGDSILNGGNQIDHDSLASSILQTKLIENTNLKHLKVLNVSSYSWGPENIYRYLNKHGLYSADLAIIINNSDDAYDSMTFKNPIIGNELGKPDKNYSFATIKLIEKLFFELKNRFHSKTKVTHEENGLNLDLGFIHLVNLFKKNNIPYIAYLHADLSELKSRRYKNRGNLIIDFYKAHNVEIIKELNFKGIESFYLDDIHFNSNGQKFMANILYPFIYSKLVLDSHTMTEKK